MSGDPFSSLSSIASSTPAATGQADKWKSDYQIEGCDDLQLHHLFRAMAWLGEELPTDQQKDKTPFAPDASSSSSTPQCSISSSGKDLTHQPGGVAL